MRCEHGCVGAACNALRRVYASGPPPP